MLVLGTLKTGSCTGQDQPLAVASLGVTDRSFKMVCGWLPPVLILEVCVAN